MTFRIVSRSKLALATRFLSLGRAEKQPSPRTYQSGLAPVHLRRVTELVNATIEGELSLHEMGKAVDRRRAHFAQMFRQSAGKSPHQFVLRHWVERAKEMLQTRHTRVLDVAIAAVLRPSSFLRECSDSFVVPAQQSIGKSFCARRTKVYSETPECLSFLARSASHPQSS